MNLPILAWIPALPLIGALLNLTFGRWFSKQTVHTIAIAAVAAAFGIAAYAVFGPLYGEFRAGAGGIGLYHTVYTWIQVGSFKAQLGFRLDTLSAVMILIVTFVGLLIHIYSTGYMAHDPRYSAFFGYLNLFTGSMLILVLAANMPVMFIGWEGVGLCSFLLIGFWYENDAFASAGRKAFVVNRIGDFAFLLGMFLLFWATKSIDADAIARGTKAIAAFDADHMAAFRNIVADRGSLDFANLASSAMGPSYVQGFWGGERLAAAAGILLFIGACGKSAQLPLFVWLPDAMAGPTPVSALIHAATMVTAGVYMVCRLSFLYASSTTALIVVATIGLLTALAAAFMAFAQTDLKKVLAYSTVSQLGFMFVAAGTGNWVAAIFHLGTHAFFKACLFLGAGSVMHAMEHEGSSTPGDIMTMGGLRARLPRTHITFLISCLAIAGIIPFSGFFSKDEILGGAFSVAPPGWPAWYGKLLWFGLLTGALGTAFYMWRLYFLVFAGDGRSEPAKHAHES
ncbi:MAG TPA: NADH-quinone oxidoreductase subunit L, partial [Kofleriaceae bacterium]|nr:NADH-quinone oxidoreductase subunit L [Kofleriaceae bacterium]